MSPLVAGHLLLQLRVVACFFILVGVRVVNVFVPLYYKKIINALTVSYQLGGGGGNHTYLDGSHDGSPDDGSNGLTLPIVPITIYVFLRFLQVCLVTMVI